MCLRELVIFKFNSSGLLRNYWWFHLIPFTLIRRTEILHAAGVHEQLIPTRARPRNHLQTLFCVSQRRRTMTMAKIARIRFWWRWRKKKQINIYQILCWAPDEHIPVSEMRWLYTSSSNEWNKRKRNKWIIFFRSFVRIHSRQSFAIRPRSASSIFIVSLRTFAIIFLCRVHNLYPTSHIASATTHHANTSARHATHGAAAAKRMERKEK